MPLLVPPSAPIEVSLACPDWPVRVAADTVEPVEVPDIAVDAFRSLGWVDPPAAKTPKKHPPAPAPAPE